ncbi:MAG TPA: GIY-YIG nuclease family protein [Polyangiaceae bacterium]|jgi:hypothetical protein
MRTDLAAEYCRTTPAELRKARERGLVRGSRRGGTGHVVFFRKDLDAYLTEAAQAERLGLPFAEMPPELDPGTLSGVYFVQVSESVSSPVKIGFARRVASRLSDLQVAHPTRLVLRAVAVGNLRIEKETHDLFAAMRIRGEWFEPRPALVSFIAYVRVHGGMPSPEEDVAIREIRRIARMEPVP